MTQEVQKAAEFHIRALLWPGYIKTLGGRDGLHEKGRTTLDAMDSALIIDDDEDEKGPLNLQKKQQASAKKQNIDSERVKISLFFISKQYLPPLLPLVVVSPVHLSNLSIRLSTSHSTLFTDASISSCLILDAKDV
jgi:hypothetical protein